MCFEAYLLSHADEKNTVQREHYSAYLGIFFNVYNGKQLSTKSMNQGANPLPPPFGFLLVIFSFRL